MLLELNSRKTYSDGKYPDLIAAGPRTYPFPLHQVDFHPLVLDLFH